MTPEEARALLDGTTPGPWEVRDDAGLLAVIDVEEEPVAIDLDAQDCALVAAAPTLAEMVAGMREEWGVSYRRVSYRRDHENEKRTTWGWDTREDAERSMRLMTDVHVYGITRRYVTAEEEV